MYIAWSYGLRRYSDKSGAGRRPGGSAKSELFTFETRTQNTGPAMSRSGILRFLKQRIRYSERVGRARRGVAGGEGFHRRLVDEVGRFLVRARRQLVLVRRPAVVRHLLAFAGQERFDAAERVAARESAVDHSGAAERQQRGEQPAPAQAGERDQRPADGPAGTGFARILTDGDEVAAHFLNDEMGCS